MTTAWETPLVETEYRAAAATLGPAIKWEHYESGDPPYLGYDIISAGGSALPLETPFPYGGVRTYRATYRNNPLIPVVFTDAQQFQFGLYGPRTSWFQFKDEPVRPLPSRPIWMELMEPIDVVAYFGIAEEDALFVEYQTPSGIKRFDFNDSNDSFWDWYLNESGYQSPISTVQFTVVMTYNSDVTEAEALYPTFTVGLTNDYSSPRWYLNESTASSDRYEYAVDNGQYPTLSYTFGTTTAASGTFTAPSSPVFPFVGPAGPFIAIIPHPPIQEVTGEVSLSSMFEAESTADLDIRHTYIMYRGPSLPVRVITSGVSPNLTGGIDTQLTRGLP